MAKKIIPREFKTHLIDQLIESITEEANSIYYSFVGDHISTGETEQEIVQPDLSNRTLNINTYRNMIFGKKITSNDMKIMIKRNVWVANTVFAKYDDEDITLYDKNFYVVTDEGAFKHVYKCLNNANNSPSTIQPVFNDFTFDDDNYYETADGYQWKYMYSISDLDFNKFSTQKYIPVIANTSVEENAKNGSIDVIKIQTEQRLGQDITLNGKFYNNYLTGKTFNVDDIAIGNTVQYRIPSTSSTVRGFYGNTILHIVSGSGAGQYKRIVDSYYSQPLNSIIIQTDTAFALSLDATSRYELSPEVLIVGDGTETRQAFARAVINANSSNSVHRIEILDPGLNYNYATATILNGVPASAEGTSVGDLVIPTEAIVTPIIPPPGGHGANTIVELGGSTLCIYTKFSKDEDGTIPIDNSFAQFGIIRDPQFANVEISVIKKSDGLSGTDGNFVANENAYQFKKILLAGNVDVEIANSIIVSNSNNTNYDTFLNVGDYVYISSSDNALYNIFSEVKQVINANAFEISSNSQWSSSNTEVYFAKVISEFKIKDVESSSKLFLKNVRGPVVPNELIAGQSSFAVANVIHIDINSKYESPTNYNFNVFTQYIKCIGTITGQFEENEIVFQGASLQSPSFTAVVHSSNSSHLYLTNTDGVLNTALDISGSSAIMFGGFDKYNGDLDATSGSVIYLQNEVPVLRANNQSEEIRVILEF
jgi:hypothetical protein